MAHCSSMSGPGNESERKQLLHIKSAILDDPVALDKWPQVVLSTVKSVVDAKMVKGLISKGDDAEAVHKTLELWFSYGSTLEELVKVFREDFKLNALADKLMEQTTKASGAANSNPIWFEVGQVVPNFTGREAELKTLHEKMTRSHSTECCVPIVVCGLGGIGKSTLVRKYAHRNREFYDGNVIWINAETVDSMKSYFQRLATKLKLEISDKNRELAANVYAKFSAKKSLFIFDNVEDKKEFNIFKPTVENPGLCAPHVLITSRRSDLVRLPHHLLQLGILAPEEALTLIMGQITESSPEEARKLADKLQYLPLALQQTLAYIHDKYGNQNHAVPKYLEEYEKFEGDLLNDERFQEDQDDYTLPVLTTWNVTLARIKETDTNVDEIMKIIAYLDPNYVQADFVGKLVNGNPDNSSTLASFRTLEKFSMISVGVCYARIHRLVQSVIRLSLSKAEEYTIFKKIGLGLSLMEDLDTFDKGDLPEWGANFVHVLQLILKQPDFVSQESDFFIKLFGITSRYVTLPTSMVPALKSWLNRLEPKWVATEDSCPYSGISDTHERMFSIKWLIAAAQVQDPAEDGNTLDLLSSVVNGTKDSLLKFACTDVLEAICSRTGEYSALLQAYDQVALWHKGHRFVHPDLDRFIVMKAFEGNADALMKFGKVNEAIQAELIRSTDSKNRRVSIMERMATTEYMGQNLDSEFDIWKEVYKIHMDKFGGEHWITLRAREKMECLRVENEGKKQP